MEHRSPGEYPTRIDWVGAIRIVLDSGETVTATRATLVTSGDFLEGEFPDYALWVEASLGELRKLGLPPGLLPEGHDARRVLLALEAPEDVLDELNDLGATRDLDALMDDARFLDLAFGLDRLRPSYCDVVVDEGSMGVAA